MAYAYQKDYELIKDERCLILGIDSHVHIEWKMNNRKSSFNDYWGPPSQWKDDREGYLKIINDSKEGKLLLIWLYIELNCNGLKLTNLIKTAVYNEDNNLQKNLLEKSEEFQKRLIKDFEERLEYIFQNKLLINA